MPKINVYLPDDLAAAVRQAQVPVSSICQQALAEAVRAAGAGREAIEAISDPRFDAEAQPEVGARLMSQMTPRLRGAFGRARDLAGPARQVDTPDLLVGMIDEPDNMGVQVLRSLDVDVGALREAGVRAAGAGKRSARRGTGARPRDDDPLAGLSKNARLAVAAAMEGAIGLGHGFLGCEHLVLGLAGQAGGKAAELLGGLGIDEDRVRRAIPAALGAAALGYRHGSQMLASPATGRLDDITRRLDQLEQRLRSAGL